MAIGNFGSGSGIVHAGFSATVTNPGVFAEELPFADGTPITQTNGHRVTYFGLVKTVDPITVEILFNPTIMTLPTNVTGASDNITYTIQAGATDMVLEGVGRIQRWEMGELTHDGLQTATLVMMFAGGATGITHTQGIV